MPANVETMFSVRETPWHGLGRIIMDAPASREALELAGLDWQVESRNIYSGSGSVISGYRATCAAPMMPFSAWCLTAIASCRTRKHSSLQMTCWAKVLLTKLPVLTGRQEGLDAGEAARKVHYRRRRSDTISCVLQQP